MYSTEANATLRAIDLSTEVICPAFIGYLMTLTSVAVGAGVIVLWNATSVMVEAYLYIRIYSLCAAVSRPKLLPHVVSNYC